MKIFNEQKTQEILNPDLSRGYLINAQRQIGTTMAQAAIPETGHYVYGEENGDGIKSVVGYVIDTPKVHERAAEPIYEDIRIYVPYTDANLDAPEIRLDGSGCLLYDY